MSTITIGAKANPTTYVLDDASDAMDDGARFATPAYLSTHDSPEARAYCAAYLDGALDRIKELLESGS
jgi:hypothetical protein